MTAGDFVYRDANVPVFASANGSRLVDLAGREYIDAEAANGAAILGYDRTLLDDVLKAAAALPCAPSFVESKLRLSLATRINELVSPHAFGTGGRVSFEVGGAQAIEQAMRVAASNRPGASTVVVLRGGYHGRSPFTGELGTSARYRKLLYGNNYHVVSLPMPPDASSASETAVNDYVEAATKVGVEDLAGAPTDGGIAAFIYEPLLNVGGMIKPAGQVLARLATHFRSLGALVVADEVFTGVYRCGTFLGSQIHGVRPDIVALSKALTNGIAPLGVVWAREPLMAEPQFPPGTHSSTFGGSQLSLAAAHVVLDRLEQVAERSLDTLSSKLRQASKPLANRDHVKDVAVIGSVVRVTLDSPLASRVRARALEAGSSHPGPEGTLIASTGLAPHVVALHPPYLIDDESLSIAMAHVSFALGESR